MSNRARPHIRPGWRVRRALVLTSTQTAEKVGACDCPAEVIPGTPLVVAHYHEHGCPNLVDPSRATRSRGNRRRPRT